LTQIATPHPRLVFDLNDLWSLVDEMTPVMGGGETNKPRLALIFINPTHRNASTKEGWSGPRFPFIGTKAVWRVLGNAGLLSAELVDMISGRERWDEEFAEEVYAAVRSEGLYLTNLVKWTGPNGDLPSRQLIELYADVLRRELELVGPRGIVAFGGMPYRALTGRDVKLGEVLANLRHAGDPFYAIDGALGVPVYPCYFPVGRGNPKGAAEILSAVNRKSIADARVGG
jgi:DNA polymerase